MSLKKFSLLKSIYLTLTAVSFIVGFAFVVFKWVSVSNIQEHPHYVEYSGESSKYMGCKPDKSGSLKVYFLKGKYIYGYNAIGSKICSFYNSPLLKLKYAQTVGSYIVSLELEDEIALELSEGASGVNLLVTLTVFLLFISVLAVLSVIFIFIYKTRK